MVQTNAGKSHIFLCFVSLRNMDQQQLFHPMLCNYIMFCIATWHILLRKQFSKPKLHTRSSSACQGPFIIAKAQQNFQWWTRWQLDTISYLLHELSMILNERGNAKYRCKMNDYILALLLLNWLSATCFHFRRYPWKQNAKHKILMKFQEEKAPSNKITLASLRKQ